MIRDTQSAQILQKQDEHNKRVYHVPKCMSCHKGMKVITRMAHCFHDCIHVYIYIYIYYSLWIATIPQLHSTAPATTCQVSIYYQSCVQGSPHKEVQQTSGETLISENIQESKF